jgi:2-iminobutanoate/2-iminopropanoate deaminase
MAESDRSWQPVFLGADVPKPVGAYSPAVRAGNFVFVSGQVPRDPRTSALAGGDIESQTRKVLSNVRDALAAAGSTLDDVVSVTVYLANIDDWSRFNDVYKEVFRPPYPSRTAVGAQLRGILVEVSAVAYRKRR